jgi:hypothetical protein
MKMIPVRFYNRFTIPWNNLPKTFQSSGSTQTFYTLMKQEFREDAKTCILSNLAFKLVHDPCQFLALQKKGNSPQSTQRAQREERVERVENRDSIFDIRYS